MSEVTERRLAALRFAAVLRGARDDDEVLSWLVGKGYVEEREDGYGGLTYSLTGDGCERADEMIAENPRSF